MKWRRSSACYDAACVEVAAAGCACGCIRVRSNLINPDLSLTFTAAEWTAFLAGVKAGEFDEPTDGDQ